MLQAKLVKRGISLKSLTYGALEPAAHGTVRQKATLQQGVPVEKAKKIVKFIKDAKKEGLLDLDIDSRSRSYVVTRFGTEMSGPSGPMASAKPKARRRRRRKSSSNNGDGAAAPPAPAADAPMRTEAPAPSAPADDSGA